jgi:hypothetical protein
MTHTHTLTRTYTHLPLCHGHTLFIVTDTHQHMDRGLYTYMTSSLAQAYRLSILIDKPTPFINSWLIRLWVDNVLLISTRSLSIVIDKPIPLSIGISRSCTLFFGIPRAQKCTLDQSRFRYQEWCCKFTRTPSLHMGRLLPFCTVCQSERWAGKANSCIPFFLIHVTVESWISHDWCHRGYITTYTNQN